MQISLFLNKDKRIIKYFNTETQEHRNTGPQEHRNTGTQEHMHIHCVLIPKWNILYAHASIPNSDTVHKLKTEEKAEKWHGTFCGMEKIALPKQVNNSSSAWPLASMLITVIHSYSKYQTSGGRFAGFTSHDTHKIMCSTVNETCWPQT